MDKNIETTIVEPKIKKKGRKPKKPTYDIVISDSAEQQKEGYNFSSTILKYAELNSWAAIDLDDADAIYQRGIDYIGWCAETDTIPSFEGLSVALGVDRHTLVEWGVRTRIGQPHSAVVKKLKTMITAIIADVGASGGMNPVYAIFWLNNSGQGYTSNNSRLEINSSTTVDELPPANMEEIYAEYADIPSAEDV